MQSRPNSLLCLEELRKSMEASVRIAIVLDKMRTMHFRIQAYNIATRPTCSMPGYHGKNVPDNI
jgi:hypothetical protein